MIGRLGYGEMRIGHAAEADRYYIEGGSSRSSAT